MDLPLQREEIRSGQARLPGVLGRVPQPLGVVLMAPRLQVLCAQVHQRRLRQALHARQLATLTLAAATPPALQRALDLALRWLAEQPDLARLPLGLWLDRKAALHALALATQQPARIGAAVSVNAELPAEAPFLPPVHAATLLVLMGANESVLESNRQIMTQLRCIKRLETVPKSTSGSSDTGAVDAVAQIASAWFAAHLAARPLL